MTLELERDVAEKRAGQQSRLAEDLEPVTDPEDDAPALSEPGDLLHDRTESRDRSWTEIVPVGEASGNDHEVGITQLTLSMPHEARLGLDHGLQCLEAIVVAVGARKRDDDRPHAAAPAPAA